MAKVDELMALCDELEAKQTAKAQTKEALNGAALHHVRSATNPAELDSATRFYIGQMDTLADVPQAIPPIRETILQLAVQGKLVAQDSNDEPAAELLKRIAAEKEQLVKDGKIKKPKPLPEIEEDEIPFEIPKSWEWNCLGRLCSLITDGEHTTPQRIEDKQVPLATAKNVRDGYLDLTNTDFISHETAEKCWQRCEPKEKDILMVCVGATTGRLCLLNETPGVALVRSVALIRLITGLLAHEYFSLALNSPLVFKQIWAKVKQTAQPCLYLGRINSLVIPVPPLAEQHRIVAKVDELMALCDQLEARLTTAQDLRQNLTEAVLHPNHLQLAHN